MKRFKISFLFFFQVLILVSITSTHSQENADSLAYYSNLALRPEKPEKFFKAYNYFENKYEFSIKKKDSNQAINSLYYKSSIEYKIGLYDDSEYTSVKAITLLDKMANSPYHKSMRKSLYNLLALVYAEKMNKAKSIQLNNKTLAISNTAIDSMIIFNNNSLIYKDYGELEKAKKDLFKAQAIIPRVKDSLVIATVLDNLGFINSQLGDNQGLLLMIKALKLRKSADVSSKIYTSYKHLAQHFYKVNDNNKTSEYSQKAYILANKLNLPSYRLDALDLLIELKNYNYIEEYKRLSDSIYLTEKRSLNKFMLLKYDNSEYKRKVIQSKLDKGKEETKSIIALSISAFIIISSIFLYFLLKTKHKKEKLQQVYKAESRISKRVHDEVANDIYQVMSKLQSEPDINTDIQEDIEQIYTKARDISKQLAEVNFTEDFKITLNDLLLSFNDEQTSVISKNMSLISWDTITKARKIALYKVLQELLINMKKHSKASVAIISFSKQNQKLEIVYTDDGIGCDINKGVGLQNVENRIKSINGSVIFESEINKGFKAKITI